MNVHSLGVLLSCSDGSGVEARRMSLCRAPLCSSSRQETLSVFAGRRKKSLSRKAGEFKSPLRPPSFFIKQSPVPSRRPLRCVPSTVFSDSGSEDARAQPKKAATTGLQGSSSSKVLGGGSDKEDSQLQNKKKKEDKADRVSKWASLFEAAKSSPGGSAAAPAKDADAWFDKIFPKNASQAKEGNNAKLSAQQEKSIQQLQTLVKTLGVATRSPPPAAPPRSKASKLKQSQLPIQGGVDPVPFSSILKKLQSVSQQENSKQQLQDSGDELGSQESEEFSEESSEAEDEQEEEEVAAAEEKAMELSRMTVLALKSLAKSKGLSGYSKLKKDELVDLLAKS